MDVPLVCIVIVNWNGKADTLACLQSLSADRYPRKAVVVVDNGSTDDSVQAIRRAHPWVTVVQAGRNLGFGGANNLGLDVAERIGADFIYFLNNDTASDPWAVSALVEAAGAAGGAFGLVTPIIHYFDEPRDPWFAGARLDLSRGVAVHDNRRVPAPDEAAREVPWASGCAMLARTAVLRSVGGFDDRYFLNWEDVDLSLRLRRAGQRVGLVPAARVYHKVGRSFASAGTAGWYYYVRNHLLLLREHGGRGRRGAAARVGARRIRDGLSALRRGEGPRQLAVACEAIRDHLAGRYGPRGSGSAARAVSAKQRAARGERSGDGLPVAGTQPNPPCA